MAPEDRDVPFWLLTTRLALVADIESLIADVRDTLGADDPALIVIDTLSRSLAGSVRFVDHDRS